MRSRRLVISGLILGCCLIIGLVVYLKAYSVPMAHLRQPIPTPKKLTAFNPLPKPEHVVIVVEENHAYKTIIGNVKAPYMNALAKKGVLFTNSYGVTHPSQPNYLALFSGSTQGVTNDRCPYSFHTSNLATELLANDFSFVGYSEGLPAIGYTGCHKKDYYRKHAPWVDFSTVSSDLSQPLTNWPIHDFSKLPTVSFVIPNVQHDMHNGTIEQADAWLKQTMDPYVKWATTHNSLLIVTWDEDDFTKVNRIPTLMVGPMVQPGQSTQKITHYSVLKTIEEMYHLPLLGYSQNANVISGVWKGE